jgi:hypothetical protein
MNTLLATGKKAKSIGKMQGKEGNPTAEENH